MTRMIIAMAALLAALASTVTATADEHDAWTTGACVNSPGQADVYLTESGGVLTFSGAVLCDGAHAVDISQLRLRPILPAGPQYSGNQASCSPCGDQPVVAYGTAIATEGLFEVSMRFDVDGLRGYWGARTRRAQFLYVAAQPIRICSEDDCRRWPGG